MRISLQEAADELGVHYQTAYRWVREGQLRAVKVAGSYAVDMEDIDALRQERATPTPPPPRRRIRNWARFSDRVALWLLAGDEPAVQNLFAKLVTGGVTLAEICDRVMVPALVVIGQEWFEGRISVAAEHRASAICERVLGRWSSIRPGRPRGVAVVCSAPTDEHKLPGDMVTAVLRENHWQVHHLGIGVPAVEIRKFVATEHAEVVVISVTWPPARILADVLARDLRADGCRVFVGRPKMTMDDLLEEMDSTERP